MGELAGLRQTGRIEATPRHGGNTHPPIPTRIFGPELIKVPSSSRPRSGTTRVGVRSAGSPTTAKLNLSGSSRYARDPLA